MLIDTIVLASMNVMRDPSIITGAIAWVLGHIVNFFFNFIYAITADGSLGIAIILMTIFTRCLLLPLAVKQQKSMFMMQKIQPEIKKIQDKYKNQANDPEIQKKMTMETQKLYAKYKYNPFSGCLPMLIQLPIFLGLYQIMRNPFMYINEINSIYSSISEIVLSVAGSNATVNSLIQSFGELGGLDVGVSIDVDVFNRILNILDPSQVKQLVDATGSSAMTSIFETKQVIENFCGINLTETVGFAFNIKLVIPILSALTTFLSSWLMSKKNKTTDPAMASQQRIMNIVMPLMMAWITVGLPAGVGLYWITSNIFVVLQQFAFNLHFDKKLKEEKAMEQEKLESKKGGKK